VDYETPVNLYPEVDPNTCNSIPRGEVFHTNPPLGIELQVFHNPPLGIELQLYGSTSGYRVTGVS
jgi:hypothetical protein